MKIPYYPDFPCKFQVIHRFGVQKRLFQRLFRPGELTELRLILGSGAQELARVSGSSAASSSPTASSSSRRAQLPRQLAQDELAQRASARCVGVARAELHSAPRFLRLSISLRRSVAPSGP